MAQERPFNPHLLFALAYLLPSSLIERLQAHCAVSGDDITHVIADAVDLHLDESDGAFSTEPWSPSKPAGGGEVPAATVAS